ncbi:MAG: glutathione S-transferase family protein [Pseudomonadota bacterium]
MKLYITKTSPYARMARVVVREKGLHADVDEEIARTREPGSPFYKINPSGRIPCLLLEDGSILEDSPLIISYLDQLKGRLQFQKPEGSETWANLSIEATARAMVDGLSVWLREMRRAQHHRSPIIIAHEAERANRLAEWWEGMTDHPLLTGPFNLTQLTLITALELENGIDGFEWRSKCPKLARWAEELADRPSLAATRYPVS